MIHNGRLIFLLIAMFGMVFLIQPGLSDATEIYSVSLKNPTMAHDERIVGFEVRLKAANIYSVPKVPIGWDYKITNSLNEQPPWNTILYASIGVGNAALYLEFFKDFLTIEKYSGKWAENLEFDINVKLNTTVDFKNYNEKIINANNVILKKIPTKKSRQRRP
jgi:hypothetical protein